MKKEKQKIIIIVGQTATGKSALAVHLAKKFNGEVISADSRQVYKDLNIGTGKITKKEMSGVSHHLLDIISPQKNFSVEQFKNEAEKAIKIISNKGKVSIICGGTGFYISTLIDNTTIPQVPPNKVLRRKLEKREAAELFKKLQKLDPERAEAIDPKNKVRLVRAIEIVEALGKVPKLKKDTPYNPLLIGTKFPDEELKKRIKERLLHRIKKGMIHEAEKLHTQGLSYKRMRELGLEYKYLADLLQNKLTKKEFVEELNTAIWQYAKRQNTWFKRDKRIRWFHPKRDVKKIEEMVTTFLNN